MTTKMIENQKTNLMDNILVTCEIICDACNKKTGTYGTDDYSFSEYLFSRGWRFKNGRVLCPSCIKSKTKKKNIAKSAKTK